MYLQILGQYSRIQFGRSQNWSAASDAVPSAWQRFSAPTELRCAIAQHPHRIAISQTAPLGSMVIARVTGRKPWMRMTLYQTMQGVTMYMSFLCVLEGAFVSQPDGTHAG